MMPNSIRAIVNEVDYVYPRCFLSQVGKNHRSCLLRKKYPRLDITRQDALLSTFWTIFGLSMIY